MNIRKIIVLLVFSHIMLTSSSLLAEEQMSLSEAKEEIQRLEQENSSLKDQLDELEQEIQEYKDKIEERDNEIEAGGQDINS